MHSIQLLSMIGTALKCVNSHEFSKKNAIHNLYPFRVFEIANSHIKLTKETKLCYPFSFIAPQQFEDLDEIVINNTQLGFPSF